MKKSPTKDGDFVLCSVDTDAFKDIDKKRYIQSTFIFPSGLYRRSRNFTLLGTNDKSDVLRRLYCRYGISPNPKDIICNIEF